jgi:deoxyribodipyrimidine photolyase-related protein
VKHCSDACRRGTPTPWLSRPALRHLVLVLGDQLDLDAAAFDGFDAARTRCGWPRWRGVHPHVVVKPRIACCSCGDAPLRRRRARAGLPLHYRALDDPANRHSLAAELDAATSPACARPPWC